MSFLLPNQQRQSTEGKSTEGKSVQQQRSDNEAVRERVSECVDLYSA